jgi:hypothetical protein
MPDYDQPTEYEQSEEYQNTEKRQELMNIFVNVPLKIIMGIPKFISDMVRSFTSYLR